MDKRFIVLVDFSVNTAALLSYAHSWAGRIGASLLLVHRVEAISPMRAEEATRDMHATRLVLDATEQLEQLVHTFIPGFKAVTFKVVLDSLVSTVIGLLREPFNQLVLTGLKDSSRLRKVLIGSETLRLINHTEGILVAMPPAVTHFTPNRIYVAITTEFPFNDTAFEAALSFFGAGIEALTFFHLAATDEQSDAVARMLDALATRYGNRYPTETALYQGAHRMEQIKSVINSQIEEILVIQRGSRMWTDQLFRTFTVNELVHEGRTPLMVLPQHPIVN